MDAGHLQHARMHACESEAAVPTGLGLLLVACDLNFLKQCPLVCLGSGRSL